MNRDQWITGYRMWCRMARGTECWTADMRDGFEYASAENERGGERPAVMDAEEAYDDRIAH